MILACWVRSVDRLRPEREQRCVRHLQGPQVELSGAVRERLTARPPAPSRRRGNLPLAIDVAAATYTDGTAENETKCDCWGTSVNPNEEESDAPNQVGKIPFSDPPERTRRTKPVSWPDGSNLYFLHLHRTIRSRPPVAGPCRGGIGGAASGRGATPDCTRSLDIRRCRSRRACVRSLNPGRVRPRRPAASRSKGRFPSSCRLHQGPKYGCPTAFYKPGPRKTRYSFLRWGRGRQIRLHRARLQIAPGDGDGSTTRLGLQVRRRPLVLWRETVTIAGGPEPPGIAEADHRSPSPNGWV